MYRSAILGALVTVLFWGQATRCEVPDDQHPAIPARERYLLLDERLIHRSENAVLRVGQVNKHPENPLFGEEYPWEARFDNLYPNVIFDQQESLYKIWYKTFTRDAVTDEGIPVPRDQRVRGTYGSFARRRGDGLCYAVSQDGIRWRKLLMNLHPHDGQPTNLVTTGNHGVGVFKDLHESDSTRVYKILTRVSRHMAVRFSADGIRWDQLVPCPEMAAAGDTHNNAFWSPQHQSYIGFTRLFAGDPRQRVVGRTESADFLSWTPAKEVLRGEPQAQVYSMPVFEYAGVYLGLPAIFRAPQHGGDDRVHTELAWSPDTVHWHRVDPGSALIPNWPEDGQYDWGCVYASKPVFTSDSIRLYYGASNGPHTDWRDSFLALATLRPDGFAGYTPENSDQPAIVETKWLTPAGKRLAITCDSQGASVSVTVLDPAGNSLATSKPVIADVTDHVVQWHEDADPMLEANAPVRLRFQLERGKLYSFRFVGE